MYQIVLQDFFLKSNIFTVKMTAVKTISFILSNDVEHQKELTKARADRVSQKKLFKEIFHDKSVQYNNNEMETQAEDVDDYINEIAEFVQLYSSLFCANFVLRKALVFELSKIVLHFKLPSETAEKIFKKILTFLKCDAGSLMDHNNLDDLLSRWFYVDIPLDR